MNTLASKDVSDLHQHLGREGLSDLLQAAVAHALISQTTAVTKPAKSDETPAEAGEAEVLTDNAGFVSDIGPEVAPFPVDLLPGAGGAIAREVARSAMVPSTLAGMNVLGILSASVGAGLVVASGGGRVTGANLFVMPVAASGSGKGQSFGEIARPFLNLERQAVEEWREGMRRSALAEKKLAEARLHRLSMKAKDGLSAEDRTNVMSEMHSVQALLDEAEKNLREPVWCTEQATKEAVEQLVEQGSREALASLSAEARGAVDTLMGRYRDSTDEGIFLAGYSGDPVRIHRRHSRAILLRKPCITLLWLLQPDKLRSMLESSAMSESGLLPRFLIADTHAQPEEEPEVRDSISENAKDAWAHLIEDLCRTFHENQEDAAIVQPELAAKEALREYFNEIVRRRRPDGDLSDVAIYAARWGENAWRLALVLHAATHGSRAADVPLSLATAQSAILLMRWFADAQLCLLASGREEQSTKRLLQLKQVLAHCPDRSRSLRELGRRNGFSVTETRQLLVKYPEAFVIETLGTGTSGRPSMVVRLR